jgi:transcriptional antiterminator RfaH
MSKEWFVIQFKPNSHYQATKNLNLQGFNTFLPLHETTLRKASRFVKSTKPLFPGYMFVSFDKTENKWRKIKNTYGVSRIITFNSSLKSIPSTFVDNLKKRYDSSGKLIPILKMKKGDKVKIFEGPFANFIATVEEYESEERIWVLMDLMGRKTKMQTPSVSLQSSN